MQDVLDGRSRGTWVHGKGLELGTQPRHWGSRARSRRVRRTVKSVTQLRTDFRTTRHGHLRNTAISLLCLTGWTSIAAGPRHHTRDSQRPVEPLATP